MIKAVLLDLDDTLLGNPAMKFTEDYLAALDRFLVDRLGLQGMSRALLLATREVLRSQDPLRTNDETFWEAMKPLLPVSRNVFDPAVAEFYRAVYPDLQVGTVRRSEARPFVEWLLEQGLIVAVATNPFFPQTAIEQRLGWAGLPVGEIPFRLVTTMENVHFTKPHLAYYEEILARVGVQADEAIMVGDDWENDMLPARAAGLNTYWVNDKAPPDPAQLATIDGHGSLADFARLVQDQNWLETLTPRPLEPAQILPRLSGNLAAVLGAVREVPPHAWQMYPDEAEWSPVEVICHLVESEREVQRPRLETILREENSFLSAPNSPPGPATRVCPQDGWRVALAFAAERQKTLAFLAELDGDAWHRPARHSIFGPTTLLEMANFTAQHDRLHLTQLCQTVWRCV
jgi:FMN phosphatase YigB (HAD superfamily)